MATNRVQLRVVKPASFFHKPSPAQLRLLDHSDKLLQAFFSETPQPIFQQKITLTDQYLIISDKIGDDYAPSLILQLTDTLTFQKILHQHSPNDQTEPLHGFSLINEQNKVTRIYLQFRPLSELWISRLASCLNQIGFHDDYRVLERIGRGSTSTVYKVQRLSDGRIMAAKVFLKGFLQSKPQRKSSVFNEISLLRAMEHENILKITEVYESTSAIYIISELLEGGTLFERINQQRGFKLTEVKQIIKGIIEGLTYMHRFGIMHRDIKLENIMFRSKDSLEVVIVDFGLAAISQEQPYIFYRCGTPGYIAPQIIGMESNKRIDPICDIFSAGVILHILLTNRYLFEGNDNQQIYRNNKCIDFDLDDQRYCRVDADGMALLSEMLEVDPQERLSAEDMLSHQFFDEVGEQSTKEKEMVSPALTTTGEVCYIL